jgi:hypothetical protein
MGWKPVLHPEGSLYFYHVAAVRDVLPFLILRFVDVLHQNAYTSSNLYDMETRQAAGNALYVIQRATSAHSGILSRRRRHETMIALAQDQNGDPTWYYYLVDHESSVIFWTSNFDGTKDMLEEVPGATEISHIRESHLSGRRYRLSLSVPTGWELESQYWWVHQLDLAATDSSFAREHWHLFPNDRDISPKLIDKITRISAHAGYGKLFFVEVAPNA